MTPAEQVAEVFPGRIAVGVKEAAEALGCSDKTIYNLLDAKRCPVLLWGDVRPHKTIPVQWIRDQLVSAYSRCEETSQ
jgi:hypothetical protein